MIGRRFGKEYSRDLEKSLMNYLQPREGARLNRGLPVFENYKYIESVDKDVEGEVQHRVVTGEIDRSDGAFVMETGVVVASARSSDGGQESKYDGINYDRAFALRTMYGNGEVSLFGVLDGVSKGEKTTAGVEQAVELFDSYFKSGLSLLDAAKKVDAILHEESHFFRSCAGVLMQLGRWDDDEGRIVDPHHATVVYAGDAKILTIRNEQRLSEGTTKFQSLAQKDIDDKVAEEKDLYTHSQAHVLTNSFGSGRLDSMNELSFDTQKGDTMVMASDGFWDVVSEYETIELSKKYAGQALQDELFQLAMNRQGANALINIEHEPGVFVEKNMKRGKGIQGWEYNKMADNITVMVVAIDPIL